MVWDRSDVKKMSLATLRVLATAVAVAFAVIGSRWLWVHYNVEPWTRDGRVRADIVEVSPDINGLVTDVCIKDGQAVRKGQVLFIIDQSRYELAERQAEAAVAADEASLAQARRDNRRNLALGTLVTTEEVEEGQAKVEELSAQLRGARVERDLAKLNLARTTVRSTVNGIVTNLELEPGDYASVGHQFLALVDTDSIYVDGYFEETKLPWIRVGDRANVHLMGVKAVLHGTVVAIAAGIEDRERNASSNDLANVTPTFSWVRLAQRIPVRVKLDPAPDGIRLIAGRTATVAILVPRHRPPEGSRS
ncbi:MAG: efflux RND transporter periplasmic adaptor subunit [Steroidobacteraceae bacterium]